MMPRISDTCNDSVMRCLKGQVAVMDGIRRKIGLYCWKIHSVVIEHLGMLVEVFNVDRDKLEFPWESATLEYPSGSAEVRPTGPGRHITHVNQSWIQRVEQQANGSEARNTQHVREPNENEPVEVEPRDMEPIDMEAGGDPMFHEENVKHQVPALRTMIQNVKHQVTADPRERRRNQFVIKHSSYKI